jgi:hypothetical protein
MVENAMPCDLLEVSSSIEIPLDGELSLVVIPNVPAFVG